MYKHYNTKYFNIKNMARRILYRVEKIRVKYRETGPKAYSDSIPTCKNTHINPC